MNIKRYLFAKVSFRYYSWESWKKIGISKYWSGRLIDIHLGKFAINLDCRINVLDDMITGKPK